jgi:prepilin-type N-terminal cleavage/methylation domain-containing protein
MSERTKSPFSRSDRGFTLIEVLVGLIIGTLVLGGVMGLISVSLNFTHRVKEKSQVQPILEAAAQEIIAHPEEAAKGALKMEDSPGTPSVNIGLSRVLGPDGSDMGNRMGDLYRVQLNCRGHLLEFSLIIPKPDFQ